jgi:hypothetical protein
LTGADAANASLLEQLGLRTSPAPWTEDRILAGAVEPLGADIVAVSSLQHPLKIIASGGRSIIAFDYAYFLLLRSLCRALLQGGSTDGALISLYQFEIGTEFDRIGLAEEAAGLLRSACELRSRYAVYQETRIFEAFLYELATNVCIAHEQAHRLFENAPDERQAWLDQARFFLDHFDSNVERMFSDQAVRADMRRSVEVFLSDESLLEEVACDLCAIHNSIERAVSQRPGNAVNYTDGYYAAARIAVLSLYLARTVGSSAALIVREVVDGRVDGVTADYVGSNLSFMSELRLRFQILLLKVVSMKVGLKLIAGGSRFESLDNVIETNETRFAQVMAHVNKELQEMRGNPLIDPHLQIGRARRWFAPSSGQPDNGHLVSLYLREFWFCHFES